MMNRGVHAARQPEPVKSSFCNPGECIEVEWDSPMCHVIITQVDESRFTRSMQVTPAEFTAFARGIKNGDFDRFINKEEETTHHE